jgi:hypothetical protein
MIGYFQGIAASSELTKRLKGCPATFNNYARLAEGPLAGKAYHGKVCCRQQEF